MATLYINFGAHAGYSKLTGVPQKVCLGLSMERERCYPKKLLMESTPVGAAGAKTLSTWKCRGPEPAGWALRGAALTYILLVVLALRGHRLLRRALQAAVRAALPEAVRLLGRPGPGRGPRDSVRPQQRHPAGAQKAEAE